MTLFWFKPPRLREPTVADAIQSLHPLGIRWEANPHAPSVTYYWDDGQLLAEIGDITVYPNGIIKAWPHSQISDREAMTLAGCALSAFESKPSRSTGWEYRAGSKAKNRRGYWRTNIVVGVEDDSPGWRLIARHAEDIREQRFRLTQAAEDTLAQSTSLEPGDFRC